MADEKEAAFELFERFEKSFPAIHRRDKWYFAMIGALVGCNKPALCGRLYAYLINQPEYTTSEQRRTLIRRIREALIKLTIVAGIPSVMAALLSIASLEQDSDKDHSRTRLSWKPDSVHEQRALNMLDFLYQEDFPKIMDRFKAHPDIEWISTNISYGYFLSDMSVLNLVETELVVLPAIMCQQLYGPALWHLRCCLRAGISRDDVESIHRCIELVATWAGRDISGMARVEDVKERLSHL